MSPFTRELVRIARFYGAFEREAVCCGTVTVAQCLVLEELLGGPRDLKGLAAFAGSSPSAMTRLVDGLVKRGSVVRERDPDDRRRVVTALTDAGRREAEGLVAMSDAAVARVVGHIPVAERGVVLRALGLVGDALERARAEADAATFCC